VVEGILDVGKAGDGVMLVGLLDTGSSPGSPHSPGGQVADDYRRVGG
jgi:hypothetical protein